MAAKQWAATRTPRSGPRNKHQVKRPHPAKHVETPHTPKDVWAERGVSTKARKQDTTEGRETTDDIGSEKGVPQRRHDRRIVERTRPCLPQRLRRQQRWQRRQDHRLGAAGTATTCRKGRRNKTYRRMGGRRLASLYATVEQRTIGNWLARSALHRHRRRRWRPQKRRGNSRGQTPNAATTDGTLGA